MRRAAGRISGWSPRHRVLAAVVGVLLGASIAASGAGETTPGASSARIRDLLERPDGLRIDGQPLDVRALGRFYRPRDYAPAWDAPEGERERASALLRALATADAHGLDPGRYGLEAIRARGNGGHAAELDLLLTAAFLDYARDIRTGRLPPARRDPDWGIAAPSFDVVSALTEGVRRPATFPALLASLPPPAQEYGRLVEALRRYRAIAARGDWPAVPPGAALRRGDDDARVAAIRARLAAEGEPVAASAPTRFDVRLDAGVRRFQTRHGLAVDGVVGEATVRAMNVPASDRIQQIILNLERWRWLPRDLGPRHITVNAADATLQVAEEGRTVLTSRVVVGDPQHPTPVVQARVEAVILNPAWNVPTSIAAQEILPRLRENRRYLAENDIVILERRESDPFGLAVDWSAVSAEAFPFRLQQRPGPDNPLGRIKLDVPNRFDVYLHDTPTRALFARPRRTASHGCIRVERADDLAAHVLSDGTGRWTPRRLAEAIAGGASSRIPVARPLPVYILYWTAFVGPDGLAQFRDDVYGRDRYLEAELGLERHAPARDLARAIGGCPSSREEASS
ncbi:MAG TPA: L,D-transpeptidase family protein [Methylomirabilota bacterium]|nr:L,D-transpeptidase family protein [Methylomirabilota bacterium]